MFTTSVTGSSTQEKTGDTTEFTQTTTSLIISDQTLSGNQIKLNNYGK